jgi:thiol peroxidase
MKERSDAITFKGHPLTLVGEDVNMGDTAPDFTVVGVDLAPVKLSDFAGKPLLLVSVPSLDTPVCSLEARRFDTEAKKLGDAVRILVISMDLPFAQSRWADEHKVANITAASDHREASFGLAYGLLVKELRLLARAVLVVDRNCRVVHKEIVREISNEPDYDKALMAVRAAV